ncbi:MAG: LysR family transcriptional regulator [Pseudomonadota bacterium]
MNLSVFNTFLTIAETGQLNRAAEQLHVTQSTVTTRLNNLEAELGQTLFHRRKSGTELTSAGFRFQRYAQLMIDTWRQARQETALPAAIDTTFNLGCHHDLWQQRGDRIFEYLHESHPEVAISCWSGDQPELDRWLGSGLIDVALGFSTSQRDDTTAYRLPADRLIQISTRPRARMRWDPEYIYVDSGESFRRQHALHFSDGDTPTVTLSSSVWAREYLLKQGGSGYLPLRLVSEDIKRQRLYRVADVPEFERNVYFEVRDDAMSDWPWFDKVLELLEEKEDSDH